MPRAIWHDTVLADSEAGRIVEGNYYFPPDAVRRAYLRPSAKRTHCPWKGEAHYYDVVIGGAVQRDAAWTYPQPKPAAGEIRDHVAFEPVVQVVS